VTAADNSGDSPAKLPQGALLISLTKPLASMTTLEISADAMELIAVLSRLAQKRDKQAVQSLANIGTGICKLLERVEEIDAKLLDFLPELAGMPVYLSPKVQAVERVVARLSRLRVGSRSIPPTWRGTQIEPDNFYTSIAMEIICRVSAYRQYFHARRRGTKGETLPYIVALLNVQRFQEIWPPPRGFSKCYQLPELSAATEPKWWIYGKRVLDQLWRTQPELYGKCIELDSVAVEAKDSREGVRRTYARKKIHQAFKSIAKNTRVIPKD
jgi:hypothetical protein